MGSNHWAVLRDAGLQSEPAKVRLTSADESSAIASRSVIFDLYLQTPAGSVIARSPCVFISDARSSQRVAVGNSLIWFIPF
jgi:hypothetical protein